MRRTIITTLQPEPNYYVASLALTSGRLPVYLSLNRKLLNVNSRSQCEFQLTMRCYYRSVHYCRKIVFMSLPLLWHGLVGIYYVLLMVYRRWYTDGLRTPGMVGNSINDTACCHPWSVNHQCTQGFNCGCLLQI